MAWSLFYLVLVCNNHGKLVVYTRLYSELTKTSTALSRLAVTCVLSAARRLVLIFVNPLYFQVAFSADGQRKTQPVVITGCVGFSKGLVQFRRQLLAAKAFLQTFYCSGFFAFALSSWFFVGFTGTQLGKQAGFFNGTLETAHGYFKRFVFFYANRRHFVILKIFYLLPGNGARENGLIYHFCTGWCGLDKSRGGKITS